MPENPPATRVVLLGASNIANGFPVIVDLLRSGFFEPLEIHAAFGHGRSYGRWSRVFLRELPGIIECPLWDEVSDCHQLQNRTVALLTDIGNDLLYGIAPQQLRDWVADCIRQLKSHGADIIITQIPLQRLLQLTQWQFRIAQSCFFPISPARWPTIRSQIPELHRLVAELAEQEQITCIEQPQEWYGYDPIHHRGSLRLSIWQHILSHWQDYNCSRPVKTSTILQALQLRWLCASKRKLAGMRLRTIQPVYDQQELKISLH